MASAISRLLGNQQKPSQNNIQNDFNKFYADFIASGKNPMQELQNKLSTGQITQQQLQGLIQKAKQIAPLLGKH